MDEIPLELPGEERVIVGVFLGLLPLFLCFFCPNVSGVVGKGSGEAQCSVVAEIFWVNGKGLGWRSSCLLSHQVIFSFRRGSFLLAVSFLLGICLGLKVLKLEKHATIGKD